MERDKIIKQNLAIFQGIVEAATKTGDGKGINVINIGMISMDGIQASEEYPLIVNDAPLIGRTASTSLLDRIEKQQAEIVELRRENRDLKSRIERFDPHSGYYDIKANMVKILNLMKKPRMASLEHEIVTAAVEIAGNKTEACKFLDKSWEWFRKR